MKSPKISIIITNYNLGEYIDDAVESALNQKYENFDVYLVNDGSTEELSKQKVKEYLEQQSEKFIVIDKKNEGLVKSRNYAASLSDAEYFAFLDGDDIYREDFLAKTIEVFEKSNDKLGFVTSDYKYFGNYDVDIILPEPSILSMLIKNSAHTASLISRKAFEEVKGYDFQFTGYMDWDLWLSLIEKGYSWKVVREPIFNYRVRDGSMVTKSIQRFDDLFSLIIKKHKKLYSENCINVISRLQTELISQSNELNEKNRHIDKSYLDYRALQTSYLELEKKLDDINSKKLYKLIQKIYKLLNK